MSSTTDALPAGDGSTLDEDEVYVFPTSFAQQRLWFLDRLEPGSTLYHMPNLQRMVGPLDLEAFRRAVEEVVRRHEVLRTTFPTVDGEPVQAVLPAGRVEVPVTDLAHLEGDAQLEEVNRIVPAAMDEPFDLARGPLFRVSVFRLAPEDHILGFAMHHIVSDGWSLGVLSSEINVLYDAFRQGLPSPLPELPIQYGDFAVWQREHLQGEELERQVAYWKAHFAGAPPALELPLDHPRPVIKSNRGADLMASLPKALVERLSALGHQEGATLFMVLLAAFKALLSRWAGQDRVVVGTPIAGREQQETEPLIGLFINTLALHTDLSGDPPFRDLVRRVREVTLGAYAHQDLPFEKLVEELKVERSLSVSPVFQAMFNLLNAPTMEGTEALTGTEWAPIAMGKSSEKYDLTLTVSEHPNGAMAALSYNPDLFTAGTMERMALHYRMILEAVAADPSLPLSRIPLMGSEERRQLARLWRGEDRPEFPQDGVLHRVFEAQAARTPDAPALLFRDTVLTYAELDARAGRLARILRARGVGPDVAVAFSLERSAELMVALLGILKAGGAYVPIDPTYPRERRAFMLEDSGARVVLAQTALLGDLPAHAGEVIVMDEGWDGTGEAVPDVELPEVHPRNAAYVIYTSGSTGKPKGVVIEHRSACHFLAWIGDVFAGAGVRLLPLHTRVSFDASLRQLFGLLLRGQPIWVLPEESTTAPADLLRLLGEQRGAAFNSVPSLWAAMMDAVEAGEPAPSPEALVAVYLGGERLDPEVIQRTAELFPHVLLRNVYGPTEITSTACSTVVSADEDRGIGRPIPNTFAFVVDARLQPCPIGVPGELCVSGPGVARGYHLRPGLTADRFVPDAFSGNPGARMYRTGDRARFREDGTIEYMGRLDDQVKVRGYRIELGEIESVLRQHPAVADAAAAVREDRPGDKRIAAYYVVRGGTEVDAVELRSHCADRLPEFMVPSVFMALDDLPRTPNGKADRRALPVPDPALHGAAGEYVEAETPVEETIAAVWREALGVDRVGANDNFFEIGGYSLLLTRVQLRLREALGRDVAMVDLFRFPTVRSLAGHLAAGEEGDAAAERAGRGREKADARRAARDRRRR